MEYVRRELQTRGLGDILSETFRIYGRNFLKFIAIAAIVGVPLAIIDFFVRQVLDPGHLPHGEHSTEADLNYFCDLTLYFLAIIGISVPFSPIRTGALVYATCEQHLHHPVSIRAAYKFAWRRMANLVLAYLLFSVAFFLLVMSCIGIPFAIYLGVKWEFAPSAIILEGHGPVRALSRSGELVRGKWCRVAGMLLVLALVTLVVMIPVLILHTIISHYAHGTALHAIRSATSTTLSVLAVLFGTIGTTLIYYDLRLRKEGFNIDTMAKELGIDTGDSGSITVGQE